ncbi:uncharacterized protein [Vicugna pacos]|uniref:Uncharacterized protein n=1 Tax=Vicugna pacos TaxID=30538 RepID=A0ABM5CGB3_VICPA
MVWRHQGRRGLVVPQPLRGSRSRRRLPSTPRDAAPREAPAALRLRAAGARVLPGSPAAPGRRGPRGRAPGARRGPRPGARARPRLHRHHRQVGGAGPLPGEDNELAAGPPRGLDAAGRPRSQGRGAPEGAAGRQEPSCAQRPRAPAGPGSCATRSALRHRTNQPTEVLPDVHSTSVRFLGKIDPALAAYRLLVYLAFFYPAWFLGWRTAAGGAGASHQGWVGRWGTAQLSL